MYVYGKESARYSSVILIILSFYIMTFTMPFVDGICGVYIRTGLMLLCLAAVLSSEKCSSTEVSNIIIAFLFIDFLNVANLLYMGYGVKDAITTSLGYTFDISLAIITFWIIKTDNYLLAKSLIKLTILTLTITAFTTYIGLTTDTNAARVLATTASSDDIYARQLGLKNVGGYTSIYYLVLSLPIIICMRKDGLVSRFRFIIISIVFFLCILRAQYATALILFAISYFLILVKKNFSIKKFVFISSIILLSTIILSELYYSLFMWFVNLMGDGPLNERFTYIANSFITVDTGSDIDNRRQVLLRSITSFFKHPIIGNWLIYSRANGGHSYILDNLSKFGLLGIIGITTLYRRIYRFFFGIYKDTDVYSFVLWCFIETIALSTINTGRWTFIIGYFVPLSAYLMNRKKTWQGYQYESTLDS